MIFLYAFLIGGAICALAQFVQDFFKLTTGHITAIFVMLGVLLDAFGIYDTLVKWAEAGALLPITSFGHTLAHGGMEGAKDGGIIGMLKGIFKEVSAGMAVAITLSVVSAIAFKPKE